MKILALCGSLRENSSNALLLKAAQKEIKEYHWINFDISKLPYFDPDNQYTENTPKVVLEVRALAAVADVIFVVTPEYAHGIPGILKNAFEWIFHEGTQKKPVYVVIGSVEGENTQKQLIEILSTMDFSINAKQTLLVKAPRTLFSSDESFKNDEQKKLFLDFCRFNNS